MMIHAVIKVPIKTSFNPTNLYGSESILERLMYMRRIAYRIGALGPVRYSTVIAEMDEFLSFFLPCSCPFLVPSTSTFVYFAAVCLRRLSLEMVWKICYQVSLAR